MFTGLIEGIGRISEIVAEGPGIRLKVTHPDSMTEAVIGDSVAINGCCLTIVEIDEQSSVWDFQAGSETLSKTNIGELKKDHPVNLERALAANARLGGHFVQGHVDGKGSVSEIRTEGDWVHMQFSVPEPLTQQMVGKGSITVDGISLTVVTVDSNQFSVALIPHTLDETTLGTRKVGDIVNIETDILGKYVEKLIASRGDNS